MSKTARIYFIDNLRIFLISLVVLHHLSITYGASGGWYYKEVEGDLITTLLLTMFTATNQSFFMGFFFLISAFFTKIAYDRKSTSGFLKDKILRLGLPLLLFYFFLSPLTIFFTSFDGQGFNYNILEIFTDSRFYGFGPLWFVETLILFSLVYVLIRKTSTSNPSKENPTKPFPKTTAIILLALLIGVISFVIRLWLPVGWELKGTGFQLAFFPQYIAMMVLGIFFAKFKWFEAITYQTGIKWFAFAQFSILLLFPLMFYLGMNEQGAEPFLGGWKWQSAAYAIWDQLTGFALMIGLIGIFKKKFNAQGSLAKKLSGGAYAVFIIHPVVIVALAVFLRNWELYPILKFVVLSPLALISCFAVALLLKQVPGLKRIL